MARDLLNIEVFRKSIEISANLLKNHDVDLVHILTHDDASLFENILNNFVSIIAVQVSSINFEKNIS